jgi:hypothetical protein
VICQTVVEAYLEGSGQLIEWVCLFTKLKLLAIF